MKKKQYAVIVSGIEDGRTRVEKAANSMTGAFNAARSESSLLEPQKVEADQLFKDCFKVIAGTSRSEVSAISSSDNVYVKVKRYMI